MTLYLLRYLEPLGNCHKRSGYYLGYCADGTLQQRLAKHESGWGSSYTRMMARLKIPFELAWTGKGDRNEERRLKKAGHYDRLAAKGRQQRRRICKNQKGLS